MIQNRFQHMWLVILLLVASGTSHALTTGDSVPNIFGRTLNGKLFRLSEVNGPMLLNFFSYTCLPCRKELPELAHLEQEYPDIRFIIVHVDEAEKEDIQAFVDALPSAPKTIVAASPMVKDSFGIKGLPYTVLVNSERLIQKRIIGFDSEQGIGELKRSLEAH